MPMMSLGSRSGVHWIRWNPPEIDSAITRAAVVLASPGTPSSKMCPPVSKPISNDSRK